MATPSPSGSGDAPPRRRDGWTGPGATPDHLARPDHPARPARRRPDVAALEPGDRLGDYLLDRVIGEGGMGVVWLALDPQHRAVALKVLRPHIAGDPLARARLAREVATLERVRSPRVAEVLDADVDSPLPHLVTRYVPGQSLEVLVESRGPLRGTRLRDLGHGLAEALRAIHATGVVHRDLKPGNVLLLDHSPVVIDFGIAHVADDVRLTSTGLVMGTPGYLSPEVVGGGEVSTATDWWGWAATVAFAVTGRPPFGTGPMEVVLDRVRRADVDLAGVPADLRGPLLAALAVDPAHRPGPGRLLSALDGATTAPQVVAAPQGAVDLTAALPPTPAVPRSRFASLVEPDDERGTTVLPVVPAAGPGGPPPVTGPADATSVLPALAPPTAPLPQPPPRPTAQHAPPGWIPDGPGPAAPVRPARPASSPAGGAHPAARPRTGADGQPARPQRSRTLLVGLLALTGVFAVAPAAGLVTALAGGVLARTVDRVAARLFRRRWEAGPRSTDSLVVTATTPWNVVRATVSTALASVLPVLVGVSVLFIGSTLPVSLLGADPGSSRLLALSGLAGTLVAWFGPGGRSLQRGARTTVRSVLRGERETRVVIALLLLVPAAALIMVWQGVPPDWRPLPGAPFTWLR